MATYKIIKTKPIPKEYFLEYYLGNTEKEATDTYNEFEYKLKSIAKHYRHITSISEYDLFAEAITGLARAKRDYTDRALSFRNYATYRIKEAIHDFIRKNIKIVTVPFYIYKASILYNKLKTENKSDNEIYNNSTLMNYAEKARITCKELIERITMVEHLPIDINKDEYNQESNLINSITINRIKNILNEEEIKIVEGIMEDRTYSEIAEEYNKTPVWVNRSLTNIKKKVEEWKEQ